MSRLITAVAAVALFLGLALASPSPARAAAPEVQSLATAGVVKTSWSNCTTAAARGSSPYLKVLYALTDPRCGWTVIAAAGNVNAASICWMSRQWWGYTARWVVWMVTSGRYTVC